MRFSLNGWPPVASHVAVLLLGMSLVHLTRSGAPPRLTLPPKAVALAMTRGTLDAKLERGAKVHLVAARGGAKCRLGADPLTVLDPGSVAAWISPTGADVGTALKALQGKAATAESATEAGHLPLCQAATRVTYGAH